MTSDKLAGEADQSRKRGYQRMKKDDAIRRIEEVENQLADLVREAKADEAETTMTPIIKAEEVDKLRRKLTDARADLVREEMKETFGNQIEEAEPGDTIVFDEVRATVKNIEKDDDE